MQRVNGRVVELGWALTVGMVASMVTAGCGLLPWGATTDASSSSPAASDSTSAAASASSSPTKAATPKPSEPAGDGPRYVPPANACDVVTSADKARLDMTKVKRDDAALQVSCALSNTPQGSPTRFRNLRITYNTAPAGVSDTTAYAKSDFNQRKTSDFQHPNAFAGRPIVAGGIQQTGTSKAGQDFDEGYYVYYLTDTAGAKDGNGLAVLRKGDVVIAITASGTDIPGRRVVDGRPIKNETTQHMIDLIADHVIQAVEQKSS